jgi:hypothetical protein
VYRYALADQMAAVPFLCLYAAGYLYMGWMTVYQSLPPRALLRSSAGS